jgi:hypothetical protein
LGDMARKGGLGKVGLLSLVNAFRKGGYRIYVHVNITSWMSRRL